MDESTATLVGAFIGGIIGIAGTYLGSIYTAKKQRFFTACQRLREAFHDELAILSDPSDTSDPADVLQSAFKKHLSAVIEFKYVLSGCRLDRFNKAWNEYYYEDGEISIPFLEQYSRQIGAFSLSSISLSLSCHPSGLIRCFKYPPGYINPTATKGTLRSLHSFIKSPARKPRPPV